MNNANKDSQDDPLEMLFQQARADPPRVPEALMARVLADAQALQPDAARPVSRWRALLRAVGGGPALGGLVTASCLGFWLGVAPPAGMPDLAGQVLGQQDDASYDTSYDAAGDVAGFGWDQDEG